MAFQPFSFLLGLGAAWALPTLGKVLRPLAVQAAAVSFGLFDDARRVLAEQVETVEDIIAEARARREDMDAESETPDDLAEDSDGGGAPERRRRRGPAAVRPRA
jgi:hypothetical protein